MFKYDFIEIELYSFPLPFYPLAPPNCFALNPSYRLIACFFIIFIYAYICVYVCVYTKIYKYDPLSPLLLFLYVASRLTTLHWTANKGSPQGEANSSSPSSH